MPILRSQLDRSPSLELESRLSDKSNHFNHSPAASYTEIRLFATDDEHSVPLTKRQWVTFAVFGFVEIFSAMVISLQAPFYPLEVVNYVDTRMIYLCTHFICFWISFFSGRKERSYRNRIRSRFWHI